MSEDDIPPGRSGSERLFWQDGRWRPGVLIDWARWNPEADADARAAEGRPTLSPAGAHFTKSATAPGRKDGGWRRVAASIFSNFNGGAAVPPQPAPAPPAFADGLPPTEAPPRTKWQ